MKQLLFLSILVYFSIICEPKYYSYEGLNQINDYKEGLYAAQKENKPIFLYFTAHGACAPCSQLVEIEILSNKAIYTKLKNEFINVWLYVDDRKKVKPYQSSFSDKVIKTLGHKWIDLQQSKFGEQSQPLFIILNADGEQISPTIIGYKEARSGGLLSFLESIEQLF